MIYCAAAITPGYSHVVNGYSTRNASRNIFEDRNLVIIINMLVALYLEVESDVWRNSYL